jgi:hypothetical protein
MTTNKIFILFLSLMLFFQGCREEEYDNAKLVISPETILIDSEKGKIYLSVEPAIKVKWELDQKPQWLKITPTSGTINKGITELSYEVVNQSLWGGLNIEAITIRSKQAAAVTAMAHINVAENPVLELSASNIQIAGDQHEAFFTISNRGLGNLSWEFKTSQDWLTIHPAKGSSWENQSREIKISVDRAGLPPGTEQAFITVVTNSNDDDPVIAVNLEVLPLAVLSATVDTVHFGHFHENRSFFLRNTGNIPANWNMQIDDSFITTNIHSGVLPENDSVEIQLFINREGLLSQTYYSNLRFTGLNTPAFELEIEAAHYNEEKWLIQDYVLRAYYDRNYDYLYMIFDGFFELRRLNPLTREITSVPLIRQPIAVSISRDGNFAAVAHSTRISYVNLQSMTVENVYQMDFVVGDALLADGWIYIFPASGNDNRRVKCLEISSGNITDHTGASQSAGLRAKLHPSGNSFYAAYWSFSSYHLRKFDITTGTAHYLYSSWENAGNLDILGNFWITDDGGRAIIRSRIILKLTDEPSTDMLYGGQLSGDASLSCFDYSSAAGVSLAAMTVNYSHTPYSSPGNFLRKYSNQFMAEIEDIDLPKFLYPSDGGTGTFYEPECHFVFFNSEGSKAFAVVKSRPGSGSLQEWAVATLNME